MTVWSSAWKSFCACDHWIARGHGLDRAVRAGGIFCDGGCDGGEQSELEDSGVTQGCACDLFGVGLMTTGSMVLERAVWMRASRREGPCGVGEGFAAEVWLAAARASTTECWTWRRRRS